MLASWQTHFMTSILVTNSQCVKPALDRNRLNIGTALMKQVGLWLCAQQLPTIDKQTAYPDNDDFVFWFFTTGPAWTTDKGPVQVVGGGGTEAVVELFPFVLFSLNSSYSSCSYSRCLLQSETMVYSLNETMGYSWNTTTWWLQIYIIVFTIIVTQLKQFSFVPAHNADGSRLNILVT